MIKNKKFISPAKVNLFFQVLKKREDGFHEIISLNKAVSLYDEIFIKEALEDRFACSKKSLETSSNLVVKAVDLFRKKTKKKVFLDIYLKKNIPEGGGLGGGSSNAATVLWALKDFFRKDLSNEDLMEFAKEIGSDVSFFFSTGSAICRGRGEKVLSLKEDKKKFFLAISDIHCSTKLVYENFRKKDKIIFNDLEDSAFEIYPKLKKIKKDLLEAGCKKVMLSGSGSSFICFGRPKKKIEGIKICLVETILRNLEKWYF